MNLKNGGTTDFDYNSVLGTSGTYIRFSMVQTQTHTNTHTHTHTHTETKHNDSA